MVVQYITAVTRTDLSGEAQICSSQLLIPLAFALHCLMHGTSASDQCENSVQCCLCTGHSVLFQCAGLKVASQGGLTDSLV